MRLTVKDIKDPELRRVTFALETVLSNLSKDNFKVEELTGTTAGVADTMRLFRHNLKEIPSLWFILEGDVYVPRYGVTRDMLNVQSRLTNQDFRILLVS